MRPLPAVLGLLLLGVAVQAAPEPLYGFSPESSAAELKVESNFRAAIRPENCRAAMEHLSARPHHVGSPYDEANAHWILDRFQAWGWSARIETFNVLFPTPQIRVLEMTEPVHFSASLAEPPIPVDPTSSQTSEQLPPYNAYSIDGDVTGPLVFVNYGLPEDYKDLDRMGVSVQGAIVIAKYGRSWRGIKPKVAAEHGAIGCILYSDPADDGYGPADVFPQGPMRNEHGVQRGSVMDFPLAGPGDPLTPGWGATNGAPRLPRDQVKTITKIPVLPISYGDASPLLAQLKGRPVPPGWRGGLPFTYHVGPGPAIVHLKLAFNWDLKPVRDVVAMLPGGIESNQWVLRGNHYDAWVNGAEDPISGQVCLLEEARVLGQMAKQGWKPRRTLIYCAWDGEEPGLLGSTEWVETHAAELRQHAVAYINSDNTDRGFLNLEGSHILERLINDAARSVDDPEVRLTVWKRRQLDDIVHAADDAERHELRERRDLRLAALGSGSDYTAFLDFIAVPSLNLGFGGETPAGVYHSAYDDFYWYTHFSDTNFTYARALAQTIGTAALRLADADVIPFEFSDLAETLQRYTSDLQNELSRKRNALEERQREIDEGAFLAVSDPWHPLAPPAMEPVPPDLNFAPLLNAVRTLKETASKYEKALTQAQPALSDPAHAAAVGQLNKILLQAERQFIEPSGLPGRPWFKHLLYAPGEYAGYGAKTLPGAREGIEQGRYEQADAQLAVVARALKAENDLIESATRTVEQISH